MAAPVQVHRAAGQQVRQRRQQAVGGVEGSPRRRWPQHRPEPHDVDREIARVADPPLSAVLPVLVPVPEPLADEQLAVTDQPLGAAEHQQGGDVDDPGERSQPSQVRQHGAHARVVDGECLARRAVPAHRAEGEHHMGDLLADLVQGRAGQPEARPGGVTHQPGPGRTWAGRAVPGP